MLKPPNGKAVDPNTRHILSRFTTAVNPARLAQVDAAGGIDAWFDEQLSPDGIPDQEAETLWDWFPVLALSPYQKWLRYKNGTEKSGEMMQDLASWSMLLRLSTNRQLLHVMMDFWANVVHVPSPVDDAWVYRVEYEDLLRRHALGSFTELLQEAIPHPCMGLYLDNVKSTATELNENLGRELLECHTVGLGAEYTQHEVVDSARILTGFHVDREKSWDPYYAPEDHWCGRVRVLGFHSANTDPDGRRLVADYLAYLARHESTAARLCRRLAVRFVSDDPSPELVASLAQVYLDNHTQIIPVLKALVASEEFKASAMQKVRTPVEDALATWGVLGVEVARPRHEDDAGNQFINFSKRIGQVVFDWPAPNGFPDVAAAWTSSGRMLGSMRAHWSAAGANWPTLGIVYPGSLDWMPQLPAMFEDVVAHIVGLVLSVPMTQTMLDAACTACDIDERDVITEQHALLRAKFARLMVSILDTPEHMSR